MRSRVLRRTLLACSLATLVVALGCRTSDRQGAASVVVALENDIQTLDPTMLSDPYTSRVVWQMYEGLVGLGEDGAPMPLIAETWEHSPQFDAWTFRIRPGVYFHRSGVFGTSDSTRTVTAEDVRFSYTRFAKGVGSFVFEGVLQGLDAYVAGTADQVSGFEVVDSLTFRIRLTRPDPSFIHRITSPYLGIMAREAVERDPDAFGRSVSVGTGPFQLVSRTETEVRLARNPRYWRKTSGNLAQVTFRVEKNPQLRITQFRNGNYDLLQLPLAFVPEFVTGDSAGTAGGRAYRIYRKTTYNVHFLGINDARVPDVQLRRAIAHAIDKASIVRQLLHGQAEVASGPVLPGLQGYRPPAAPPFNLDSAKAALGRSAYDGRTLTILVSDAPSSEQIGQIVQTHLQAIGIKTALNRVDFNTATSRVFGQDKPELFVYFYEWIFSAPELLLRAYASAGIPSLNVFGYRNAQVDSLLNRVSSLGDRTQANELARQAEAIAVRDAPAVWLFHQTNVYLMSRDFTGFQVGGHNYWHLADVTKPND